MTKIAGYVSGSISQRHGSADSDPDPHKNVMDPYPDPHQKCHGSRTLLYWIQHYFTCRPLLFHWAGGGIESRTFATLALAVRWSKPTRLDLIHTRLDLIQSFSVFRITSLAAVNNFQASLEALRSDLRHCCAKSLMDLFLIFNPSCAGGCLIVKDCRGP